MIEYIVLDFCLSNCMLPFSFFERVNRLVHRYGFISEYRISETQISLTIKPNTKGVLIKPKEAALIFYTVTKISEHYTKILKHFEFYRVEFVPTLPF